ncbi:BBE domain-containing protein [Pseudonocardia oroxyli]|uniref:BBE domain-containing protein n=1 Tax=Pseudonocardia oroxyli TaxID=366584 RepID=UPI003CCC2083
MPTCSGRCGARAPTSGSRCFETDTGPEVVARAFPPEHLKRLQALKREWDPDLLFRDDFPIDPDAD